MRPALRVVRAAATLGAAAWLVVPWTAPSATAKDETVMVGTATENKFSPATVTIDKGDTVTWQWGGGSQHTVTSTSSNWDENTQVGPPGLDLTVTFTFKKAGTYTYECTTHKPLMHGKVIVRGPTTSPPPSPSPTHTRSPSPTATRTASPSASESFSPPPSQSPGSSETPTTTPPPSGTVSPTFTRPTGFPTRPTGSQFLGEGGLRPQPATGRGKGLPVMIALLLIGGVGSAELRAFLANAPE